MRKSTFCKENAYPIFIKVQTCDSFLKTILVVDIKGGVILNLQVWHFGFSFALSTGYNVLGFGAPVSNSNGEVTWWAVIIVTLLDSSKFKTVLQNGDLPQEKETTYVQLKILALPQQNHSFYLDLGSVLDFFLHSLKIKQLI